jgi:sporulation protein YlmC with PRC-barrel domain
MKTKSKIISAGTAGIALLAVAGGLKAADEVNAPVKAPTEIQAGTGQKDAEYPPHAYNKASSLIGMEVRNQNDERLGRIEDLVFDLSSERVSYAVIATSKGGMLDLRDKYLAVPLSALKGSVDGKHVILNAEKAKVEAAQGFDRDNWPTVGNPSWGAQPFWQESEPPATQSHPADKSSGYQSPGTPSKPDQSQ